MENGGNTPLEVEICHNCKKEVPQQNYLMHVAHCQRNLSVCDICKESVAKTKLQEHKEKQHKLVQCPSCKKKVERSLLESHKKEKCDKRMVSCQYCELELPFKDLEEHIYHCGARTDRCEECGELVMLKYQKLHKESNHGFIKLKDEPGPVPSWETNRTTTSRGTNTASRRESTHNGGLEPPLRSPNNNMSSVAVTEELTPCQREIEREERRNSDTVAPRNLPRTFVPAYDASEDLRAKVKLARHDLNNIKHSVIAGEERVKELSRQVRKPVSTDLLATARKPPPAFETYLVPYEKNKSHSVNALPLGETPVGAQPGRLFTYLGAPAGPPAPQNGPISIVSKPKTTHGGQNKGAVPKSHKKNKAPQPPAGGVSPVKAPSTPPSPKDELPCEFCGKLIPQHMLVIHETGCRPDLAQLKIHRNSATDATPPSPDVELPCEFCNDLIPASNLLRHQALCEG